MSDIKAIDKSLQMFGATISTVVNSVGTLSTLPTAPTTLQDKYAKLCQLQGTMVACAVSVAVARVHKSPTVHTSFKPFRFPFVTPFNHTSTSVAPHNRQQPTSHS